MLGGAFNPPHIGHLVLAREAAEQLGLERVLLVPYGEAPLGAVEAEPGAGVRLEMTGLAARTEELLEASDIEVAREGPSYTFHTLELLSERRQGDELCFLMGADVAAGLESWRRPERVVELARLGVAGRPGTVRDEAEAALARLGALERTDFIDMPAIGVSSTEVRQRIARGRPVSHLVPESVASLIAERGLYREGVRA